MSVKAHVKGGEKRLWEECPAEQKSKRLPLSTCAIAKLRFGDRRNTRLAQCNVHASHSELANSFVYSCFFSSSFCFHLSLFTIPPNRRPPLERERGGDGGVKERNQRAQSRPGRILYRMTCRTGSRNKSGWEKNNRRKEY